MKERIREREMERSGKLDVPLLGRAMNEKKNVINWSLATKGRPAILLSFIMKIFLIKIIKI